MADSSWDNSGRPPATRGLSRMAMLVGGTSLAIVLLLLGGLGWGGWVIWKSNQSRTAALEQTWQILRKDLQRLETEAGAKTYYLENPALADRYPAAAAYAEACAPWPARLKELPQRAPDALETQGLEFSFNTRGQRNSYLRFLLPKGGVLRFALLNDRVVGLSID